MRNIAVKVATGEGAKLCAILIKILKNLNFELTSKTMQQNVRIKNQNFQGSRKIELKTQLPLVSKKRQALNFEDMENTFCGNSSFINSLQNIQSRFLI